MHWRYGGTPKAPGRKKRKVTGRAGNNKSLRHSANAAPLPAINFPS